MPTLSSRRGVAMLVAIWLLVGITAVALQLTVVGQERRALGIAASDRGWGQGATLGALALTQARLDQALVNTAASLQETAGTRRADAWLDADSIYSGPVPIDSTHFVDVKVTDMGAFLNINTATEAQFRSLFGWLIDGQEAAYIAAAIMDWRDADENVRINGAEREDYLKEGRLALPTNGPFREPGDLLSVMGITPEVYQRIGPYLTTYGTGQINVNTAPEAVLRAIPGITDNVLANIFAQREGGLRIANLATLVPGAGQTTGGGGRGGAPATPLNPAADALLAALQTSTNVQSTQLMLTLLARQNEASPPVKMRALVTRTGTTVTIGWKQW